MTSRLVCEPGALLFLRHAAVQGVTPVWLCSDEPRTEPPGLGHTWPSPSNVEIFPLVLEMRAVSRKPMGRWQEFKRKDCQILLHLSELLRVEERQWEECFCEIFLSNFNLYSTFQLSLSLSLCARSSVRLSLTLCLVSAWINQSVCFCVSLSVCLVVTSQPCPLTICFLNFAATPPIPQPTDDVDIYFETPADDKEHSRFQRAKEQLEIRHRNRMERVSDQDEPAGFLLLYGYTSFWNNILQMQNFLSVWKHPAKKKKLQRYNHRNMHSDKHLNLLNE